MVSNSLNYIKNVNLRCEWRFVTTLHLNKGSSRETSNGVGSSSSPAIELPSRLGCSEIVEISVHLKSKNALLFIYLFVNRLYFLFLYDIFCVAVVFVSMCKFTHFFLIGMAEGKNI